MSFEILNRWTQAVVYRSEEASQLPAAVVEAVSRGADLRGADLSGADMREADLRGAYLREADLSLANLSVANLREANLSGAYLSGANLSGADLRAVRDDLWAVMCMVPHEVAGLRLALIEGRVDGSQYVGECACLVGTIANLRHCAYNSLEELQPDYSRASERWFMAITKGSTPENNQFSKLAVEWIDQWSAKVQPTESVGSRKHR